MTHPYARAAYAAGLPHIGEPLAVPEWGAPMLVRPTPLGGRADATGPYPLSVLAPGSDLAAGLERLRDADLVSVVMVPDPLLSPAGEMARHFEVCRPFKSHYLIDPAHGAFAPSKHHRQELRRAERRGRVERVALPDHLADWKSLYGGLVERRAVSGAADFAPAYFDVLAADPAMQAFAAYAGDEIIGMAIWFAAEGVVYYHLSAVNAAGYASGAAYALVAAAVEHFAGQGVVHLGGGAGASGASDGLAAFKRGFANAEIMAHVCGAVLDRERYTQLSRGYEAMGFFPAYRAPGQPEPSIAVR
jgi:hypothetical protein